MIRDERNFVKKQASKHLLACFFECYCEDEGKQFPKLDSFGIHLDTPDRGIKTCNYHEAIEWIRTWSNRVDIQECKVN